MTERRRNVNSCTRCYTKYHSSVVFCDVVVFCGIDVYNTTHLWYVGLHLVHQLTVSLLLCEPTYILNWIVNISMISTVRNILSFTRNPQRILKL